MNWSSANPVILLGAGGHAKVLLDVLQLVGRNVLGLVTPDIEKGSKHLGLEVLGDDEQLKRYNPSEIDIVNGIGSLPFQKLRWQVSDKIRSWGFSLSKVIHPSAIISADISLDEGVQVMAGCLIQAGTKIGCDSIINTGAILDHDCRVGAGCHIAPGVTCSGGVFINEGCHIGTGAVITQSLTIERGAVIAAGTTIYKNVIKDNLVKGQCKMLVEQVGV